MLTKEEILAQMPRVGDKLTRMQTVAKVQGMDDPGPKPCTVVYVNRRNLWYEVEFESGIRQGYKAPDINYGPKGGLPR